MVRSTAPSGNKPTLSFAVITDTLILAAHGNIYKVSLQFKKLLLQVDFNCRMFSRIMKTGDDLNYSFLLNWENLNR